MSRTYRHRHSTPPGRIVRDGGDEVFFLGTGEEDISRQRFFRRKTRREKKRYRKPDFRKYRSQIRDLMCHCEWERIFPYTRTSGWLTW